jgi:hypothetical protein
MQRSQGEHKIEPGYPFSTYQHKLFLQLKYLRGFRESAVIPYLGNHNAIHFQEAELPQTVSLED